MDDQHTKMCCGSTGTTRLGNCSNTPYLRVYKYVAAAFIEKTNWSSWQIGSFVLSQQTQEERRQTVLDFGNLYPLHVSLLSLFYFILAQEDTLLSHSTFLSSSASAALPQHLSCFSACVLIASLTLISSLPLPSAHLCLFPSFKLLACRAV